MKTLELKDICGYLPYGLRIMRPPTNVPVVAELLDIRKDFTILGAGHIDTYRAVLRPMSDLTKEIRQNCYNNSKPFIPIVELACMLEAQGYWRVYGAGAADFGEDGESCIAQLVFDGDHFVYTVDDEYDTFNSVAIYDKLNAWMFDYRGLISAGLAIDVNTLPENPYEL